MAYPRTIRNFNAFVDGTSYFGHVDEAKLPPITLNTEAHRGAGMDGPVAIDMGMEGMQSEITFAEWDPALLKSFGRRTRFVMRPGAMGEDDFSADTYIATLGGRISVNGPEDLKAGDKSTLKITMEVDYYRLEKDGEELWEIDIENGVRVIGGVDQLAELRRAMGI